MAIINILLLTKDTEYVSRLSNYMMSHYPDVRIAAIDTPDKLGDVAGTTSFSVALVGEEYINTDLSAYGGAAVAYLTSNRSLDGEGQHRTFCKYSSGQDIYRLILGLYAEVSNVSDKNNGKYMIYSFVSASGGAGSSTVAAAFAIAAARNGRKVMFLDLDSFDPAISFFGEAKTECMSDLIYSVFSSSKKHINLPAKAASLICTDPTGVSYIQGCRNASDFDELSEDMLGKLIGACIDSAGYDTIVIDGSFADRNVRNFILARTGVLTLVTENTSMAYAKLSRYAEWISLYDKRRNENLTERSRIVMNKGRIAAAGDSILNIRFAGSVPLYNDNNPKNVANAISRTNVCTNIF